MLPHVIRNQLVALRQEGHEPQILVNVTNDGWFWGSSELEQHLACGVFRTVECRRPMVIAANTGISASIDGDGRILAEGPLRQTRHDPCRRSARPPRKLVSASRRLVRRRLPGDDAPFRLCGHRGCQASPVGWDKLAVRQAFQPDASVRLESLTYSDAGPPYFQLAKPLDGSASVARNAVFSDHRCGLARLVRITRRREAHRPFGWVLWLTRENGRSYTNQVGKRALRSAWGMDRTHCGGGRRVVLRPD